MKKESKKKLVATCDTTTINGHTVDLTKMSQKQLGSLLDKFPNIGCIVEQ